MNQKNDEPKNVVFSGFYTFREYSIKAGGDYVLALKGNQQLYYEEVKSYFDADTLKGLRGETGHYSRTVDKEHGGTAVREYYITEDILWFSEKKKWKGLKSIGMVHKVLKNKMERRQKKTDIISAA